MSNQRKKTEDLEMEINLMLMTEPEEKKMPKSI
jgi:hypothetical protein